MFSPILGTVRRRHTFSDFALLETSHKAGESLPFHRHVNPYLTVVVLGAYCEGYRGREDLCTPQSVRFLPGGENHTNRFPVPTVCLNIECSARLSKRYLRPAPPRIGGLTNPFARSIGQLLWAEVRRQDNLTEFAVLGAIVDLFSLFTWAGPKGDAWPAPWLLRVRDYIEEYCSTALRLEELSRVAGRHPAYLSWEFRRFFGKTISQFVRERRVLKAARLLRSIPGNVSEVAAACGFYDQSHFTHAFRRMMGCTPGEYRSHRHLG